MTPYLVVAVLVAGVVVMTMNDNTSSTIMWALLIGLTGFALYITKNPWCILILLWLPYSRSST